MIYQRFFCLFNLFALILLFFKCFHPVFTDTLKVAFTAGLTTSGKIGPLNAKTTLNYNRVFTITGKASKPTPGMHYYKYKKSYKKLKHKGIEHLQRQVGRATPALLTSGLKEGEGKTKQNGDRTKGGADCHQDSTLMPGREIG